MGDTKQPTSRSRTAELLLWLMQRTRYLHQMIHVNCLRKDESLAGSGWVSPLPMTCEMAIAVWAFKVPHVGRWTFAGLLGHRLNYLCFAALGDSSSLQVPAMTYFWVLP